MSFEEFLAAATPPSDAALRALWLDARGDWEKAHLSVQNDSGRAAAWVHAYLHRKEGDAANAGYWYARAGRRPPATALGLDAEREVIARELLGKSGA